MEAILKHMVEISCHRDHTLLDISILSAIQELSGASSARVLGIYTQNGSTFVQPRAWISEGRLVTADDGSHAEPPEAPLNDYPTLTQCLRERLPRAQDISPAGMQRLWLPVWLSDKITTCLEIEHPSLFAQQTLDMLDGILGVYRNFQSLLDYSERDSLTGLLNRKTFDGHFAKLQAAAARQACAPAERSTPLGAPDVREHWLAVVDIDHFKQVNDQFGHLYGDEVLILVANLMSSSFRATDRVFRFGGEEFVVLISSSTLDNARKVVERFRRNVEAHSFPQVGHITVSVGFTRVPPFESPVAVVGHADQALYHAKTHGRNQVCHYESLIEQGLLQVAGAGAANDTAEFF